MLFRSQAEAKLQNSPPGLSPDAINGRLSTGNEYIFVSLMIVGIGLIVYDFYNMIRGKQQPSVEDDWGMPPAPAVAPPMPSMAPAPAVAPPPMPGMAPAPPTPVAAPPVNQPSTMTITVPPGVVPGQVLTVTMPSGQVVNVQVPTGSSPGSQFTITVQQ